MSVVKAHYKRTLGVTVFDARGDSPAAKLLCSQESFDKGPDQWAPLPDLMIECMREIAKEDPLGFKACIRDFVALCRFDGYSWIGYELHVGTTS